MWLFWHRTDPSASLEVCSGRGRAMLGCACGDVASTSLQVLLSSKPAVRAVAQQTQRQVQDIRRLCAAGVSKCPPRRRSGIDFVKPGHFKSAIATQLSRIRMLCAAGVSKCPPRRRSGQCICRCICTWTCGFCLDSGVQIRRLCAAGFARCPPRRRSSQCTGSP